MTKLTSLYQVREYVGSEYSRQLGAKLRARSDALRIAKRLKRQGRTVFVAPIKVAA